MFAVHPRGRLLFLLLSFPRFFPFAFSLAPLFFLLPDWSKRGVACRGSRGAHSTTNGMVHEPVCIFLPSLQNIRSVSVCWDGPNQFNAKQHSFQISSNGPVNESEVWQEVFASTLHLSGLV